jgi:hypothetical protein
LNTGVLFLAATSASASALPGLASGMVNTPAERGGNRMKDE